MFMGLLPTALNVRYPNVKYADELADAGKLNFAGRIYCRVTTSRRNQIIDGVAAATRIGLPPLPSTTRKLWSE